MYPAKILQRPGEPGASSNHVRLPGVGNGVIQVLPSWPGDVPAPRAVPNLPLAGQAGFHQHLLYVLVFPQDDMTAITTQREQAEAARTNVVQELEV